jgi:hypothetical protein
MADGSGTAVFSDSKLDSKRDPSRRCMKLPE